jgi:hypothetical protein
MCLNSLQSRKLSQVQRGMHACESVVIGLLLGGSLFGESTKARVGLQSRLRTFNALRKGAAPGEIFTAKMEIIVQGAVQTSF